MSKPTAWLHASVKLCVQTAVAAFPGSCLLRSGALIGQGRARAKARSALQKSPWFQGNPEARQRQAFWRPRLPTITAVLERLGIRQSVGRTGICFDNSLAESFNAALKVERVHRTAYPTRKKAREDIARYIEFRYNRMRLHSALGYRTPQEVHNEYLNMQAAA
jgi:putative transposase